MKIQALVLTVMVALLIFSGDALAAKPPDAGNGGGGGGSGGGEGVTEIPDYGDLIILYRDYNGVPIPSPEVQVEDPETGEYIDGGLCWQPIAFNVDDELLCPQACVVTTTDPYTVSVDPFNCGVTTGCANCTQEVDFGRINSARAPASVFEAQLEDVVVKLAIADCITLDPAGRLVASTDVDGVATTSTIDSPLQNLAIYRQLMLTGFLGAEANPIELPASVLDTAARGLGVGSDKGGEVNVDMVAYLNSIMGLDDMPTILGKLCETYREEVQGTIQLVEKCYLTYGYDASDIDPAGADYSYTRSSNFGALPAPAYISGPPAQPTDGWFEYLAVTASTAFTENPADARFQILQGPILDAVFPDTPFVEFDGGNIGGFAQAADDTRAVINFMHDWPMPDADVYGTPVPCIADPDADDRYDVSISEESGLQVPMTYVNGTHREFIVTVANAGPHVATGTVTVTATAAAGGPVLGTPWDYSFTNLGAGFSASFDEPFMIDLGRSTTITWTAVVAAEFDVNPLNNTVTATTNVKNTGGGGGRR